MGTCSPSFKWSKESPFTDDAPFTIVTSSVESSKPSSIEIKIHKLINLKLIGK